jgi:hypothetical protein
MCICVCRCVCKVLATPYCFVLLFTITQDLFCVIALFYLCDGYVILLSVSLYYFVQVSIPCILLKY